MPTLPLPGPSGIKAILMHRAKQDLLGENIESSLPSEKKKTRDIFEFEYEPNYSYRPSLQNNLIEEGTEADEPKPSTSQEKSNNETVLPNEFTVISKGHGFLAVNVTVQDVKYTGLLYSHNRNGMPGILSEDDYENFFALCNRKKPDAPMDQWYSILADRQLLPGRQGRFTKTNWARKNGRMICYSCLCVVPEEKSMPFACNCKERQRQRASRLKCGGYQPSRDRLVVVAQLDNGVHHPLHGGQHSHHSAAVHDLPLKNSNCNANVSTECVDISNSVESCNGKVDNLLTIYDKSGSLPKIKKLYKTTTLATSNNKIQKKKEKCLVVRRGCKRNNSVLTVTVADPPLRDESNKATAAASLSSPSLLAPFPSAGLENFNDNALLVTSTKKESNEGASTMSMQQFLDFSREKLAEFSIPIICTIPDQIQFTNSAPSSICVSDILGNQKQNTEINKRKIRATLSAPSSRKRLKTFTNEKRRLSVTSGASWSCSAGPNTEERSRYSERILLERAMRESLEMVQSVKSVPPSLFIKTEPSETTSPVCGAPKLDKIEKAINFDDGGQQPVDVRQDDLLLLPPLSTPLSTLIKKRKIESTNNMPIALSPKVQKLEVEESVDEKLNVFETMPQYVIRNNSPLQMTILKIGAGNKQLPLPPKLEKQQHRHRHHHHHHHHHRARRHRHGDGHNLKQGNSENNLNDNTTISNEKTSTSCDDNDKVYAVKVTSNVAKSGKSKLLNNVSKKESETNIKSPQKVVPSSDHVLRSVTRTRCYLTLPLNSDCFKDDCSVSSNNSRPIKDKRMSLEARISSIKQRLMSGVSPMKSVPKERLKLDNSPSSVVASSNNSPSKQSVRSETNNNDLPCISPSQISTVSNASSTIAASDLSASVLSRVSALIRAEIYRLKTASLGSKEGNQQFSHGIICGSLVWARAPLSAYWPGLVIGVAAKTVKVAWCGEHTYNQVDIATVNDFLGSFSIRFSPVSKEHRNNKKFCNAVAEAITLARPSIVDFDRKLNTVVAKVLITKFNWNLEGLTVYQASKPVVIGKNSNDILLSYTEKMLAVKDTDITLTNCEASSNAGSECSTATVKKASFPENFIAETKSLAENQSTFAKTKLIEVSTPEQSKVVESNKMGNHSAEDDDAKWVKNDGCGDFVKKIL